MQLPNERFRNDADHFSDQLRLLQAALVLANQPKLTGPAPIYKETGSPSCSPTRPAIN